MPWLLPDEQPLSSETLDGIVSKDMRQLKGVYTWASNCRHNRSGHLFQGCYKAILVDKENCLLELARYVVLNSVRAKDIAHCIEVSNKAPRRKRRGIKPDRD